MEAPLSDTVKRILANPDEANKFMQAVIQGAKTGYKNSVTIESKKFTFQKVDNQK